MPTAESFEIELVSTEDLHPHPKNYKKHPQDQLEHLITSIKENGFYRNVVIAKDGTILAGHGVWQAVVQMGSKTIPVIRLDIDADSTQALKVIAGDNEIENLGIIDDRKLTDMLKEIKIDSDLLGTGFDDQMLANLLFVTRPQSEIEDMDEAADWVGFPEYEEAEIKDKIVITFRNDKDRTEFAKILGLEITDKTRSTWWPPRKEEEIEDASTVIYEG